MIKEERPRSKLSLDIWLKNSPEFCFSLCKEFWPVHHVLSKVTFVTGQHGQLFNLISNHALRNLIIQKRMFLRSKIVKLQSHDVATIQKLSYRYQPAVRKHDIVIYRKMSGMKKNFWQHGLLRLSWKDIFKIWSVFHIYNNRKHLFAKWLA